MNRIRAEESRLRKKAHMQFLESRVGKLVSYLKLFNNPLIEELERENAMLKASHAQLSGASTGMSGMEEVNKYLEHASS